MSALHGASVSRVAALHGAHGARRYVAANLAGLDHIAATVERLAIDCDWHRTWASTYTTTPQGSSKLQEEFRAAADAGLPVSLVDSLDLPVDAVAALRLEDQASLDPVKLCLGLQDRLRGRGPGGAEMPRSGR